MTSSHIILTLPKISARWNSGSLKTLSIAFPASSILSTTHVDICVPSTLRCAPNCDILSLLSSSISLNIPRPFLRPSARPSPHGRATFLLKTFWTWLNTPESVLSTLAWADPEYSCIPAMIIFTAISDDKSPYSTIFSSCFLSLPVALLKYPQPDIPHVDSCFISSADSLPLSFISARALEIPSTPSLPRPSAADASPMSSRSLSTVFVSQPYPIIL